MASILLLEDDPVLGKGLQILFELENYQVTWVKSIGEARSFLKEPKFHIAVFDVGLPDGSGIDLCKEVRQEGQSIPIIMLTAQTDEDSVVEGLMSGANDYVKKPFSNKELIARIKVNISPQTTDSNINIGPLFLDEKKRVVLKNDEKLKFNRKEFDILVLFFKRKDRIVTREAIIEDVLENIDINDRTVDSHISHIRKKFKDYGISKIQIKSEYGVGYRLVVEK